MDNAYLRIGSGLGALSGLITFVGAWWYCAATYGFLLGFGLGWLPAFLAAVLVGVAVTFLWGVVLALVVVGVVLTINDNNKRRVAPEQASQIPPGTPVIIPGPNHQPASEDRVFEGDVKVENGRVYVFRNGRWVHSKTAPSD